MKNITAERIEPQTPGESPTYQFRIPYIETDFEGNEVTLCREVTMKKEHIEFERSDNLNKIAQFQAEIDHLDSLLGAIEDVGRADK